MKACAGDWVEVLSKEDILRTLDNSGRLDGLPFMPQMFKYCGQRFRIYKRADKTCDTVSGLAEAGAQRAARPRNGAEHSHPVCVRSCTAKPPNSIQWIEGPRHLDFDDVEDPWRVEAPRDTGLCAN